MGAHALLAWPLAIVLIALTAHAELETQSIGDECDSGQEFPVRFGSVLLIGCKKFAGADWCTREDETVELCPSLPIEASDVGNVSPVRRHVTSPGDRMFITEMMVSNDVIGDEDGDTPDWIEIHNAEDRPMNFKGWALTDDPDEPLKWKFPDFEVDAGQYIPVFASGKDRLTETTIHANFKLGAKGEYVALVRPDGSIASAVEGEYPRQIPNVAYGIKHYGTSRGPSDMGEATFTFLEEATPVAPNSGPRKMGPYIADVEHNYKKEMPVEGVDLIVMAAVARHLSPIKKVELTYRVMFGKEKTIPMRNSGQEDDPIYSAVIPARYLKAGEMVRWFVTATDSKRRETIDPPYVTKEWPKYYGTVIRNPKMESKHIPVMHWFTTDPDKSISEDRELNFRSSVFYNGRFYDNVATRRRGRTALTWPKPKIKFDFKGATFKVKKGEPEVEEFNLQSFWEEPGEESFMREPVAFQVMREAGVPASDSFHIRVVQNGEYYGMFAFVEQVDDTFLERHELDTNGPLFKSWHVELSNLRWDVSIKDLSWAYKKGNRQNVDDTQMLFDLVQSLGGGGDLTRSQFLFDHINLPQVINYMAVNNMVLNQDRCTKNFYVYRDPNTERWSVFPWDLEASFGISSGLKGDPAPDYCILACEQWNSPLYCDSDHQQDLINLIGMQVQTGRRLKQVTPKKINYKIPSAEQYDKDRTKRRSVTGPAGTYNHLDDAILNWPVTREMYLRRLRTLIDQFLDGRLQTIIKERWNTIKEEAAIDSKKWGMKKNVGNGIKQLLTEQLPRRKEQLVDFYGPGGMGLIPESQPEDAQLTIVSVTDEYIQLSNPHDYAVDVSGWTLAGDADFKFQPGTVVASGDSIFVTPNIVGFLNREESPTGGEHRLVVGPCSNISGNSLTLFNHRGRRVV